MPDLPLLGGGPTQTMTATLTANSTINTKAATWTQLTAATLYETAWLMITVQNISAGPVSIAFDIAVGGSGAEQVLLSNLFAKIGSTLGYNDTVYLLPVSVPRGSRLSARSQATTGSVTFVLAVYAIAGPINATMGLTRCETGGFTAATTTPTELPDCGGVASTDSTWGQVVASTSFDYHWLCISFTTSATALSARSMVFADIGVGGAGAEQVLLHNLNVIGSSLDDTLRPGAICLPVAIAAGSRLSARNQNASIVAGDRRVSLITYGVG